MGLKLFIVDVDGYWPIVERLSHEGHKVLYWGILEGELLYEYAQKVDNRIEGYFQADATLITGSKFGGEVEYLRKKGIPVWGGTRYHDNLEFSRGLGKKIAKEAGLNVPEYKIVDGPRDASDYIKSKKKPYVIKPAYPQSSHGDEKQKVILTKTWEQAEELVWNITSAYRGGMVLEERIFGTEICVGAFYNGKRFLRPFVIDYEYALSQEEDRGINTGNVGSFTYLSDSEEIYIEFLEGLEPLLTGYIGFIDSGFMVAEKPYFVEFCPRLPYPFGCQWPLMYKGNLGQFIKDMAEMKDFASSLDMVEAFCTAVCLYFYGYPLIEKSLCLRVEGLEQARETGAYIAMSGADYTAGIWRTDTSGERILWSIGIDPVAEKSIEIAYRGISAIKIPGTTYRKDVGQAWNHKRIGNGS